MSDLNYHCRVCGLKQDEKPWGEDGKTPTFNICDCCGVEFGYEDSDDDSAHEFRDLWLKNGAKWNSPKAKPKDWDINDQLRVLGIEFSEEL